MITALVVILVVIALACMGGAVVCVLSRPSQDARATALAIMAVACYFVSQLVRGAPL